MSTIINSIPGAATQPPVSTPYVAVASSDTVTPAPSSAASAAYTKAAVSQDTNAYADAALHEQVIQQASTAASFNYPLGDKEFTVFKDQSGQYITRYVSLRDGTITYIPEPTLVRHTLAVTGNASNPALVALNA